MPSDANFELVQRFVEANEPKYPPHGPSAPGWNDGSDTAALLGVWNLELMIGNGAWPSVYYNHLGWTVPLAARGYRLIGMPECAARCELAMDLVRRVETATPESITPPTSGSPIRSCTPSTTRTGTSSTTAGSSSPRQRASGWPST